MSDQEGVDTQASQTALVRGSRYLELATTLLQRMRLTCAAGGVWEAADVQWWSRYRRATDQHDQLFWLDANGEPLAAVILTDWDPSIQCDALMLPASDAFAREVWRTAVTRAAALGPAPVEFPVRDDDTSGAGVLTDAGYLPGSDRVVASWLDSGARPQISALTPGYRLLSRAEAADRPHHLAARNGQVVEQRLRRCSLYRPDLDLMVEAPDGQVAGYGLFWADLVTGVGLVEPMRTEQAHQRRGIARHILTTGLDRLAALGCDRLKVSNDIDLYLRAGFQPLAAATATIYSRAAA